MKVIGVAGIPSVQELVEMSDEELLKAYFNFDGRLSPGGFTDPWPDDSESSACHFAFLFLQKRPNGPRMLIKLHDKFLSGKVDESGNPK